MFFNYCLITCTGAQQLYSRSIVGRPWSGYKVLFSLCLHRRCVSDVISDAEKYAQLAGQQQVSPEDVMLAVQSSQSQLQVGEKNSERLAHRPKLEYRTPPTLSQRRVV